jgi:hypothetical protein
MCVHFLPFFFFFPPPCPVFGSAAAGFASFVVGSGNGVCVPVPWSAGASNIVSVSQMSKNIHDQSCRKEYHQPSATSGSAAICLPKVPRLAINLPTSAALSVLYFKIVPEIGSNVFSIKVAFGPGVVSCFVASPSSSGALRFLGFASLSGWMMLYFVVIRV